MAGNHLQIGQGIGEAATWDPNYGIQQFANVLAQKKAEQAKKDQDLINAASQLSPDKIRKPDQADYINKYNDWKQAQMAANALPQNSRDRLDALAAAQQKYADVHNFINSSREDAAHENALTNMRLQNPHMFANEANDKIVKSLQAPMSSSDYISPQNYTSLERYIDHSKVDDAFDAAHKEVLKQQDWTNPIQSQGHDKQGNKTGVVVHNERSADPETLLATDAHMYDVSDDVKASLDKRYANLVGQNPAETKMLRVRQNLIDRGDLTVGKDGQLESTVAEKTKPEFKPDYKPDNFYPHYDYRLAHPSGVSNALTPAQVMIAGNAQNGTPGMLQGNTEAMKRLISMTPKGQYGNSALPEPTIDPATGEHVFKFPAQVKPDEKAIAENAKKKLQYSKNPEKEGGFLGFGGTPLPIEKSTKPYYKLAPETKVVKPASEYRLNPADPQKYIGDVNQMASDQNIKLPSYNQILGVKGGHGIIPQATTSQQSQAKQKVSASDFNSQWAKLPKGGTMVGPDGVEYTKK